MSELRQKMIRVMELKNFSPRTQHAYLAAVESLSKFHQKSPDLLTQTEIEDYLLHLKDEGKSDSTRNVIISGLRFFYGHTLKDNEIALKLPSRRKPRILPEVLSRKQVRMIIDTPADLKHRLILMTAYSGGGI